MLTEQEGKRLKELLMKAVKTPKGVVLALNSQERAELYYIVGKIQRWCLEEYPLQGPPVKESQQKTGGTSGKAKRPL